MVTGLGQALGPLHRRPGRLRRQRLRLVEQGGRGGGVALGVGLQRQFALVMRQPVGERAGAAFLQLAGHVGCSMPVA
jgi:hypothetical protein